MKGLRALGVVLAVLLAARPVPLCACTQPACQRTGPIAVVVESVVVPRPLSSAVTVFVPFRIVNTTLPCSPVPLDVTLSVSQQGGSVPVDIHFPVRVGETGIPSNPVRIPAQAAETGVISVRFAPGASGTSSFQLFAQPAGMAAAARPFSVTLLSAFSIDTVTGNDLAAAAEERQLSWSFTNLTNVSQTVDYTLRVLQTTSSTDSLQDRYSTAPCTGTLLPGNPFSNDPVDPAFLLVGQVALGPQASTVLCIRTTSYANCREGGNCLYRLTATESQSGEAADSNQNLTIVAAGFQADGGQMLGAPVPVLGAPSLFLAFLLLAAVGGFLLRGRLAPHS